MSPVIGIDMLSISLYTILSRSFSRELISDVPYALAGFALQFRGDAFERRTNIGF